MYSKFGKFTIYYHTVFSGRLCAELQTHATKYTMCWYRETCQWDLVRVLRHHQLMMRCMMSFRIHSQLLNA